MDSETKSKNGSKKKSGAEAAEEKPSKKFINGVYVNREYSWLLFNKRVLEQSLDLTNPLLERCKFLSIFSTNLDEFFMVRIGSLYNASLSDPDKKDNKTQLTAKKQMEGICREVGAYYDERSACYGVLAKELSKNGVKILTRKALTPKQREECGNIFSTQMMPLLSAMVLDAKHPLVQFENMATYMLYDLEKEGRRMVGVISLNKSLQSLYRVSTGAKSDVIYLIPPEELVREFGSTAFEGYNVEGYMMMRVTRNADFEISSEGREEKQFTQLMKRRVESRARMNVVRVEIDRNDSRLLDFVLKMVRVERQYVFRDGKFFDYKFLDSIASFMDKEDVARLKYAPFKGYVAPELENASSMIDYVLDRDVFLSYPYDAMNPFFRLLNECTTDPRVTAINITIYRLARHSRVAELLSRAAENGKRVTVLIELCARFDEENNMYFAESLQDAGCTVLYGIPGYKVHSKIMSVELCEGGATRHITHIATGNYNESTAKQYTDLNIITSDVSIGEDGANFFRNMAECNNDFEYERLLVAPKTFKQGLISYIDREIDKAAGTGGRGYILCKMNSLTDRELMDKFIEASCAGVKIELIIRGICCLLPGVPGITENIRVISIVGRFLEHSRVFRFGEGDDAVTYIGSADLMTRNTDRRVEIAAPVMDRRIADRIYTYLKIMLSDNVKARKLCSDGKYRRVETLGESVDAQEAMIRLAPDMAE